MPLQARVQSFGQKFAAFVSVFEADGTRRFVSQPFGANSVDDVVVGGGFLWCAHKSSPRGGLVDLAKIDLQTGRVLKVVSTQHTNDKLYFLERSGMVVLVGLNGLSAFDPGTLEPVWHTNPAYRLSEKKGWLRTKLSYEPCDGTVREKWQMDDLVPWRRTIVESSDGKIRLPMYARNSYETSKHRVVASGILSIDPEDGSHSLKLVEQFPMPNGFGRPIESLSPDGRFGLRCAVRREFRRLATLDDKEFVALEQTDFFELWDVIEVKLLYTLDCAPITKKIRRDLSFCMDHVDMYLAYTQYSQSCQRLSGAICQTYPRPPNGYPQQDPHRGPRDIGDSYSDNLRFAWENDSRAFWLVRKSSLRRVDIDGGGGPTVPCKHGYQYTPSVRRSEKKIRLTFFQNYLDVPEDYSESDFAGKLSSEVFPELNASDVKGALDGLVICASWERPDLEHGLSQLADKLRKGLDAFSPSAQLDLIFKVKSDYLIEWDFFEELENKGLELHDAVRDVIEVWLFALEGSDRRFAASDDSDPVKLRMGGPMSGALAYLCRSGQDCESILRRFTVLRDGEHESYSRDVVLADYVQAREIKNLDALALSVFFNCLSHHDGSSARWASFGTLQAARIVATPGEFLSLIEQEFTAFPENQPNGPIKTKQTKFPELLESLIAELEQAQDWDQQLEQLLTERLQFYRKLIKKRK